MTDLEVYRPQTAWVSTLEPVAALAQQIANTEFVPGAMRGNVAKVTACILFGQELGLGPMQSLAKVDIIDGRPAPKAELARALVLSAGHEIVVTELSTTKCTVRGRRRGSDEWTTVSWSLDDAKKAGLDGKQNWRKWPRQMLAARATAELARLAFADCLGGVTLFQEELQDDAEPSGPGEVVQATTAPKPRTRKLSTATGTAAGGVASSAPAEVIEPPLPDEIIDAEVVEDTPDDAPSEKQRKMMFALLHKAGLNDRDEIVAYCSMTIRREIASSKELTRDEASTIIDALNALEAQAVPDDERAF